MPETATVFVGNLSSRTRERDLDDLFRKYGRVERLELKSTFAFVVSDQAQSGTFWGTG